jgi:hypothetical protein
VTTSTPTTSYTGPIFYARSDRHANHFYVVALNPETRLYSCECADHQHRQRDCKHIRRVQAGQVPAAQSKRPAVTAEQLPGESLWSASVRVRGEIRRRREWSEATSAILAGLDV